MFLKKPSDDLITIGRAGIFLLVLAVSATLHLSVIERVVH